VRLRTVGRQFRSLQKTHIAMTVVCVLLGGTLNAAALPVDMSLQNDTAPQNATNGSGENKHPKKEKPKIYPIGGDVTPPRSLSAADPVDSGSYDGKVKRQGAVAVRMVVNTDGVPEDIHVVRSAGKDLDAKAIEAIQQYRFSPAMRKGKPVATQITIESQFYIYK
jgi:TonB family protein